VARAARAAAVEDVAVKAAVVAVAGPIATRPRLPISAAALAPMA